MSINIHASCVAIEQKAVLILGDSGSGKSDLTLRLIEQCNAQLVADDRVDIIAKDGYLVASCPQNIKGLLEIRGIGLVNYPYCDSAKIALVVCLTGKQLERLPQKSFYNLENFTIPQIAINPFENSAPFKIVAALRLL